MLKAVNRGLQKFLEKSLQSEGGSVYFLLNHKQRKLLFMTHDGELLEEEAKRQISKKLSEFSELEILQ